MKDNKMKLQLAKGVKDIPSETKIIKNQIISKLQQSFERFGFSPLETPIIERFETLAAKFAAGTDSDALKEIFKVTDNAERKLALRFDLTVPMARYVAMNKDLKYPFKRYEVGRVYRDGPIKLGRTREFWQCDIDIVGAKSMLAEAELLAVAENFFNSVDIDVKIKVNNRQILSGILAQSGIKELEKQEAAIISIDKLDKIQESGVTKELLEKGFSEKQCVDIFKLIEKGISLQDLKKKIQDESAIEGIEKLEELFANLEGMNLKKVIFDVSLARGLAYYTGTVYEVFSTSGPVTSSIAAGGRYDDMIASFMNSKQQVPAVGISFGIEPIMEILKSKQSIIQKSTARVYLVPIKTESESLKVATELRNANINVCVSMGKKGISKNLAYANSLGIPYTIIIGEKELENKKLTLRNMESGKEESLTTEEIIKKLK
ncbi:histidine--tRNA ligase [archaeon]|jgi:histidyl-tRNA synthetase|nr:histidine--tRNA ligase [archaeon]MBT6762444.1 histidine--tRNA ligase [archaeon]